MPNILFLFSLLFDTYQFCFQNELPYPTLIAFLVIKVNIAFFIIYVNTAVFMIPLFLSLDIY